MGAKNSVSFAPKQKAQLLVKTGLQKGKGTDSHIHVLLNDNNGRKSKIMELNCKFKDNFESGQIDIFPVDLRLVEPS